MGDKKEAMWLPLESNPDVMNSFLRELGMDPGFVITDVWGTDPDLLMMVPQPVLGLILLFPIPKDESQTPPKIATATDGTEGSKDVYYMKQLIGNACGTIALIHLVANRPELSFKEGSILSEFLAKTRDLSPEERGKALASDAKFCDAHGKIAHAGLSQVPTEEESANLDLHFVAIMPHEGKIWELDGRKPGPVCHGQVTDENFLLDGVKVCKAFMEANPNENRFTIVALAKD